MFSTMGLILNGKRSRLSGDQDISFIHDNFTILDYGLGLLTEVNADTNWFNGFDGDIKLGIVKPFTVT